MQWKAASKRKQQRERKKETLVKTGEEGKKRRIQKRE
jgi:hypothetical protein